MSFDALFIGPDHSAVLVQDFSEIRLSVTGCTLQVNGVKTSGRVPLGDVKPSEAMAFAANLLRNAEYMDKDQRFLTVDFRDIGAEGFRVPEHMIMPGDAI